MNISDIFKKSFLEGFQSTDINIYTVSLSMLLTCFVALYIFVVYRVVTRKTFYSKNFNISLAAVAVITSGIILTIQSSIVVSLGMVGALSIVRFRTAVKDPMDLVFLFWSIATGIMCGAGLAEYAILLALLVTILILFLNYLPVAKAPLILVINSVDLDGEKNIMDIVKKHTKHFTIKSRNLTKSTLDMIVEVRTDNGGQLVKSLTELESVTAASLMSHDGEVTF